MEPREMKVRWPSSVEDSEYMRMRQRQNMHNSLSNHNENWFAEKLTRARIKYRQLGLNLRSKKARRKWVAAPELTETLSLI